MPWCSSSSVIPKNKKQDGSLSKDVNEAATRERRVSTVTPMKYDMWLVSLETLLNHCSGGAKIVHQELRERDLLTNWCDLPKDAKIVFVSHEWLSWDHPDPKGDQLRVLCRVLERLKAGEMNTEMDPIHSIMYKHTFKTTAKEWKAMLRHIYLWMDWFSMPQPNAHADAQKTKELQENGAKAVKSIPAYVERSDFIMILAPGCQHLDRKVPTCYRTWRKRGWCLLELYVAAMARDSTNPPLLVKSEKGIPIWTSPIEVMKLAVGQADFTCCQRNHTMLKNNIPQQIPCDKSVAGAVLSKLIEAKASHLHNVENNTLMGRLHNVFKQWWLRGLSNTSMRKKKMTTAAFKRMLRWRDEEGWIDSHGLSILIYAVVNSSINIVQELLQALKSQSLEYKDILELAIPDEGFPSIGIPGGTTCLMAAMMVASPNIVSLLLEHGANVNAVDTMGNDACLYASFYGRSENVRLWLKTFPDYNLEVRNALFGATSLVVAVDMGFNKMDTVIALLQRGARLDTVTDAGFSVLMAACANEDSDPEIVRMILRSLKKVQDLKRDAPQVCVNYQMKSRTWKWKLLRGVSKFLIRSRLLNSRLMNRFAHGPGITALHYAARRGDTEIVKILLEAGADPYIDSEMGLNSFEICAKHGPFPKVLTEMLKYRQ